MALAETPFHDQMQIIGKLEASILSSFLLKELFHAGFEPMHRLAWIYKNWSIIASLRLK